MAPTFSSAAELVEHYRGVRARLSIRRDIAPKRTRLSSYAPAPLPMRPIVVVTKVKAAPAMPWRRILSEVAAKHDVSVKEILSFSHTRTVVRARHEVMYRLKAEQGYSSPMIGRRLNRDHSTVLAGIAKHTKHAVGNVLVSA